MKTFNKTIQKPQLIISHDKFADSPRRDTNLGYFITVDRNYNSPDADETLQNIVKNTGDHATSVEDHMKLIKRDYKEVSNDKIIAIYPVVKYEHSGISYSLGTKHGFDCSNNGFYIVTEDTQKEVGVLKKDFEKSIIQELNDYNKWVNGETYRYVLFDQNGEETDSCSGFYDIEDIKEHLPEKWRNEDLSDYYTNN